MSAVRRLTPVHCFKQGLLIATVFTIMAIFSIKYIDAPLALYINSLHLPVPVPIANLFTEYGPVVLIATEILLLCFIESAPEAGKKISLVLSVLFVVFFTNILTEKLKLIFGRNWPNTWSGSGPYGSLIVDHVYGFHLLTSSGWRGSFPSGHVTFATVTGCTLSLALAKYKIFFALLTIAMVGCILIQNFHFLGDCLAGIAVGGFMAYTSFAVYLILLQCQHRQ